MLGVWGGRDEVVAARENATAMGAAVGGDVPFAVRTFPQADHALLVPRRGTALPPAAPQFPGVAYPRTTSRPWPVGWTLVSRGRTARTRARASRR